MKSRAPWAEWSYQDIHLCGTSRAGIGTCLIWPELGVAFDVASGPPEAIHQPWHFISHGHMDHAGGLPYLISQRALNSLPPGKFVMPEALIAPMQSVMNAWASIEGHPYDFQFLPAPLSGRSALGIKNGFEVVAFPTVHRIASVGYTVFRVHKRLHPDLAKAPREEIIAQRSRGVAVETLVREPWFSFTGDTQIEFLDGPEFVRQSKVLAMECSYYDQKRSVAEARKWGHIHLDELIPRLDSIHCEKLLLIHLSRRHSLQDAREILRKRLPAAWQGKVDVFPG